MIVQFRGPIADAGELVATRADFAAAIAARWQESVAAILDVGRLLIRAKAQLTHGDYGAMIDADLPFGRRTAQRLAAIAADARLANPTHVSHLPPAWGTLYELTKLDDATFRQKLDDGTIRPDMERRAIGQAVKRATRERREVELADKIRALPQKRYGVILADPEWRYEPRSRDTGLDRAADNHYPTTATAEIAARPVGELAHGDCVLWLWATVPMLPDALEVMSAWGFTYRSHVIWRKVRKVWKARKGTALADEVEVPHLGTGYWFRNAHELLLVGTRGRVPAPAPGDQAPSVIDAPVGEHSAKPEAFHALIEQLYPHVPKIELNRRGPPRPGWDAWGNEVESDDQGGAWGSASPVVEGEAAATAAPPAGGDDKAAPPALTMPEIPAFLRR